MGDLISRQAAINAVHKNYDGILDFRSDGETVAQSFEDILTALPSAQPFHNITMNDVLKYIDGMPEDVWQEFTACLECRGWELQRRTAKWCGGEFT